MSRLTPVALVWACFLLRGLFFCTAMPLWEGFDEYAHFTRIQQVAYKGPFAGLYAAYCSRQVERSLELVPVPWIIHDSAKGWLSYEAYWALPEASRQVFYTELLQQSGPLSEGALALYESQQPPVYYWLTAPVYRLVRRLPLPSQVWLLRLFTLLISSCVIPLSFQLALRFLADRQLALGVAALVAAAPQLLLLVCRVANDGPAIAAAAVCILLALDIMRTRLSLRNAVCLGLATSCALLLKAYLLALIPLVCASISVSWWRNKPALAPAVRHALLLFLIAALTADWWYAGVWRRTGSFTGEQVEVAALHAPGASLPRALLHMPWRNSLDFFATSFLWLGGWSFLVLRSWMYRVLELLSSLGFAGLFLAKTSRLELLAFSLPCLALLSGLLYQAAANFTLSGKAGSLGYYGYAVIPILATLWVSGAAAFMPAKRKLVPVAVMIFVLLAAELFGTWFLLLPYTCGLTTHSASGSLPAWKLTNAALLLERLTANKPEIVTPFAMATAAALYLCATAGLLAFAIALAAKKPGTALSRLL